MNYCLFYALFWIFELLLYGLNWSDVNEPLDEGLMAFLIITILISLFVGIKYRDLFTFRYIESSKYRPHTTVVLIITLLFFAEFVYCRQIPFFSILMGQSVYTSFTGIPVIHVFIVTFATYYSFYCYYLYESTNERQYLMHVAVVAFLQVLIFSRVALLILFFEIIALKISKAGGLLQILNPKRLIGLVIVAIVISYGFGVLGNLRCGYEWNDTTVIDMIGKYNDRYPDHLSSQFKWVYTYITSPLANLNNGVERRTIDFDLVNYCVNYLPDFISRRLFPDHLSLIPDPLIYPELNAIVGYYNFYYFGGFFGALVMFLILVTGPVFMLKYFHFQEAQYYVFLMIVTELVVFLFFYDVFFLSQCCFVIVYPVLLSLFRNIKVRVIDKHERASN